jgi:TonB family protein
MQYLIQTTIYAALLYAVYVLVLKDRAQHQWSRFYLLMVATLSLIIPFITIPFGVPKLSQGMVLAQVTAPVIVVSRKIDAVPTFNWYNFIPVIYVSIAALLFCRLLWQYFRIIRFIRSCDPQKMEDAHIILNTSMEPGSWGRYIFFPESEIDDAILKHELAHIQLKHSYDILLIRLLQCLFWPNIILYIVEKELRTVHEFQADALVKENNEVYARTLLDHVFQTKQFSLSNTFFQKSIKRRISMLSKRTSASLRIRIALIASLLTIIMVGAIVTLQGCKKEKPVSNGDIVNTASDQVYDMVDKMPTTSYDLADYMSKNVFYPEIAIEKNIEGRVTIKFVVDKDGNVVNPVVLKSPDTSLTSAALYAINHMPKWTPGENHGKRVNVYMVLPVAFKLTDSNQSDQKVVKRAMNSILPAIAYETNKQKKNTSNGTGRVSFNGTFQSMSANGQKQGPPFRVKMDKQVENAYTMVDKMPEAPYDYNSFIAKNIQYPQSAVDKKIQGRVLLKFVVDVDGSITNLQVINSPDVSLSVAALQVVQKMPKWVPGEKDGKKVPVYMNLPIDFKL